MKKLISLILLIGLFQFVSAQTKVTAPITRNSSLDNTYGTHFDSLGYGGYVTFADTTERNAFPSAQRRKGMMAAIGNTLYILNGGISNSNWELFDGGAGIDSIRLNYDGKKYISWKQGVAIDSVATQLKDLFNDDGYINISLSGDSIHFNLNYELLNFGDTTSDKLIKYGGTQIEDTVVTILAPIIWRMGGYVHTEPNNQVFNINKAADGNFRTDLIYIASDSLVHLLPGVEAPIVTGAPDVPAGGIFITTINVAGGVLNHPIPHLYIDSIYNNPSVPYQLWIRYNNGNTSSIDFGTGLLSKLDSLHKYEDSLYSFANGDSAFVGLFSAANNTTINQAFHNQFLINNDGYDIEVGSSGGQIAFNGTQDNSFGFKNFNYVEFNSPIKYLPGIGNEGDVLTKGSNGNVVWQAPSGGSGITTSLLTDSLFDVKLTRPKNGNVFTSTDTVVFFGNSYEYAYASSFANYLGVTALNLGVSGAATIKKTPLNPISTNNYQDNVTNIPSKRKDIKFIIIGSNLNDAGIYSANYTPANYKLAMDTIIAAILAKGYSIEQLAMMSTPYIPQAGLTAYGVLTTFPAPTRARMDSFATASKEVAFKYKIAFADMYQHMKRGDTTQIDGTNIHPNTAGYSIFTRTLAQCLGLLNDGDKNIPSGFALNYNSVPVVRAQTALDNYWFGGGNLTNTAQRNVSVGSTSLPAITTGTDNLAIGYGAMNLQTTANFNTGIGSNVFQNNLSGSSNTAAGYRALRLNLASNNTAFGRSALEANTNGTRLTAVGYQALAADTVNDNTAVGYQALFTNISGTGNVAVGQRALTTSTSSGNTAVGDFALRLLASNGSSTAMGANALTNATGGFNNAFGHSAGTNVTTGTNNAFFGYTAGGFITTESNLLILNSINRSNKAGDTTNSVFYSSQSSTAANQRTKIGGGGLVGINAYPTSTLLVSGSFGTAYSATATSLTAGISDHTIEVTATGQTITLPTAVGCTGREYTIKLTGSGTGTVATTSSQTIDGSTTYSLSAQYKYVTVQSTGANWIIIANN